MTSVIMIAPLNAANFESGNAPDTQALFADGAGGSEWREPAGGGGEISSARTFAAMELVGAGSESVNGLYTADGTLQDGKLNYSRMFNMIFWDTSGQFGANAWLILDSQIGAAYYSLSDVETPDLATSWITLPGASADPPGIYSRPNYATGDLFTANGAGGGIWKAGSSATVLGVVGNGVDPVTGDDLCYAYFLVTGSPPSNGTIVIYTDATLSVFRMAVYPSSQFSNWIVFSVAEIA